MTPVSRAAETVPMSKLDAKNVAVAARDASSRIESLVRETPVDFSCRFSAGTGAEIFFKLENLLLVLFLAHL